MTTLRETNWIKDHSQKKERGMSESSLNSSPIKARLGFWDAVNIIVGIVVGTSIFKVTNMIFSNVSGPWMGIGLWVLGGILSFIGALCYAELATTYPKTGGDYVYLSRAFGPWMGFLFGWAQLAVIFTASISAMAYAFSDYTLKVFGDYLSKTIEPFGNRFPMETSVLLAAGSVISLTILNFFGVKLGKTVQNFLTVVKIIGLAGIVIAGFFWGGNTSIYPVRQAPATNVGFAMIFIFYAFGGWNDSAFVAAEVKDVKRNIPRALFFGIGIITFVYVLVILGYLYGIGFDGLRDSETPAAAVLQNVFGESGSRGMSLVVMIAALAALNGLIFTGSRIYSALGRERRLFRILGTWNARFGSPIWSMMLQGLISVGFIALVGMKVGRDMFDSFLITLGFSKGIPWDKAGSEFDTLVAGSAPVFWSFFLLTGIAFFVLRFKDPEIERPFKLKFPFFPIVPLIFCASCGFMLYKSGDFARTLALIGIVPLVIGIPLYFINKFVLEKNSSTSPKKESETS